MKIPYLKRQKKQRSSQERSEWEESLRVARDIVAKGYSWEIKGKINLIKPQEDE